MPETALRTDELAATVAAATASGTEPSRESSRLSYHDLLLELQHERRRASELEVTLGAVTVRAQAAEARADESWEHVRQTERSLADAKAVITDLRLRQVKAILDHGRIQSRAECRAVVDLCVVAREQSEGWAQDEPGTMQDLAEIVRCYSEADSCYDARERLTAYLAERYQDMEPDEGTGRVMLTQFTGGVLSMLEDTVEAIERMAKPESGPLFMALDARRTEANTAAFGDALAPTRHDDWPGWLQALTFARLVALPREIEALYNAADTAGDRIAEERREAQDRHETACAAWADLKGA